MSTIGKRWTVRDRDGNDVDERGMTIPNNFVATAFLKHIRPRVAQNEY